MGFSVVFDTLAQPFIQLHEWDDGAEQIVHDTTINILLLVGLTLASNMLFGNSITCLVLPENPDSSIAYFHDFCFFQDKYRIQTNTTRVIAKKYEGMNLTVTRNWHHEVAVDYYQWVPFIVVLQIVLCLIPSIVWKMVGLHYFYGNDFLTVMKGLIEKKGGDDVDFKVEAVRTNRWLQLKKSSKLGKCTTMGIYVITKWLTSFFLFLQFYIMAEIYAYGEILWGVHITYDLLNGVYKNIFSGVFPQIVICKTHRAQHGAVFNEFHMRCILPQNFINSKIFLFLYWWYIFTILVSIYSAVQYTVLLVYSKYQRFFTKGMLPTPEFFRDKALKEHHNVPTEDADYDRFVDYLGNDGFLLLKCARAPVSAVNWREFVYKLYEIVIIKGAFAEAPMIKPEEMPKRPDIKSKFKKERPHNTHKQSKPLMAYSTASSSSESPSPIDERYTLAPVDKMSYYTK